MSGDVLSDLHIGATWRELARLHADRTAIIDERGQLTYRQLQSRITRFGNALRALSLDKGDRVALLVPDIREYLEADYGIMSAGFVRVPLDPRLTRADVAASLRHAGATALVTHASFAEQVSGLTSEVGSLAHIVTIGGGTMVGGGLDYETLLERASEQPLPDGDGDDLATLNFSGGTTGAPKAAMLRHRNLVAVARNTISGFDIGSDDVFLNVRPLWPIAQVILMSHLFAGATVILARFAPNELGALIARTGATRTSLVPTQLVRCLEHLRPNDERLAHLQAIYVGGSRIPPDVFARALDIIGPKIGVLYGLTEAPVTCYLPPRALAAKGEDRGKDHSQLIHSVGRVLGDYAVRIGASDEQISAGSGRSGEVQIRGGNVMAGYWRDDASTSVALRDGWLHTGDIGEIDETGNFSIVGRIKDVIRSGSSTVIPKEVEDVIVLHPAVAEVAVIGLPDAEWGEAVTAFVVAKPGMAVTEHDLVEHCRARLAGYKKPRSVRFVASLPRSHYGKVLRAQLIAEATS
jgi:acyl-CoA synthetase (AMP-forming)/AMP-acid ligase II